MARVIAEQEHARRHVVIALSGAHAYGFPSPDSDLDLKAIHIDPTPVVLGLLPPPAHADRMEVIDGVEIDYTSNEIKPVLIGVLQGNGNYVERVLGRYQPHAAPELASLAPLVKKALSRRLQRHYLGFATSQLKAFEADMPPDSGPHAAPSSGPPRASGSAKKLLYVLRTALTGAHALRSGEIVTDLRELIDEYGFPEARELIEAKRAGENVRLSTEAAVRWAGEVRRAFAVLDRAGNASVLPADPEGAADLEAWLLAERRKTM